MFKVYQRVALAQSLFTVLIVWMAYSINVQPNSGLPEKFELISRAGEVSGLEKIKLPGKASSGISFTLDMDAYTYFYRSKSGNMEIVYKALEDSRIGGKTVSLLCDLYGESPEKNRALSSDCFEVAIENSMIQSYESVLKAYAKDAVLSRYFAAAMTLWSLLLWLFTLRFGQSRQFC